MTTKTLLEMAAVAAGIEFRRDTATRGGLFCLVPSPRGGAGWGTWNPLKNDSDALWLAVRIQAALTVDLAAGVRVVATGAANMHSVTETEPFSEDLAEAARLAIVRAAAAIGSKIIASLRQSRADTAR